MNLKGYNKDDIFSVGDFPIVEQLYQVSLVLPIVIGVNN